MFSIGICLVVYLIINLASIKAQETCLVESPPLSSGGLPVLKLFYCDARYQKCCDEGCCKIDNLTELTSQFGSSGGMSPFVWLLLAFIVSGYAYFCVRYCVKKCYKRQQQRRHTCVTVTQDNQPQELNLMLSFNPNNDLERFNFENFNGAHIHVPFIPTTPVTPPPAYVTLTPPPTYNVAIHFPSILDKPSEIQKETISEIET